MIQTLKNQYWRLATSVKSFFKWQLPAWSRYLSIYFHDRLSATSKIDPGKHLLLLAWEFPPQVSGGVYRPSSFVSYASDNDWEITVLTGPEPSPITEAGRYLSQSIPKSVVIKRLQDAAKGPHPWPLPDLDGGIMNAVAVYEVGCQVIKPDKPGVILASGPPFHNFVAGMWLAKRFGWQLILDYRDEWTGSPFDFVKKDPANQSLEINCVNHADHVIFTTPSQLSYQTRLFPSLDIKKCRVIYNGWNPNDFTLENQSDNPDNKDESINITFLGNLGSWCLPGKFLSTLAQVFSTSPDLISRVKIHFIGQKAPESIAEINQFPYPEALILTDQIPKTEACQMMKSTDALLLINPLILHRYIPGKTYEYIASGTPVIVFGEEGEISNIVNQLNAGYIIADTDHSARQLEKALRNIKSHQKTNNIETLTWLQKKTRHESAKAMLKLLDDIKLPLQENT